MEVMNCGMNMGNPGMQGRMSGWSRMPVQQGTDGRRRKEMPCAGMADSSREALMKQINEASFAMDDAALFLDTHPENADAMQYYRNAVSMRENAMDAYQRQFGPLLIDDVMGNSWNWVTEKWPWEGGY